MSRVYFLAGVLACLVALATLFLTDQPVAVLGAAVLGAALVGGALVAAAALREGKAQASSAGAYSLLPRSASQ